MLLFEAKKAVKSDDLREEWVPFVSEGSVSLTDWDAPGSRIILMGAGAEFSVLLLEGTLPFCEETATVFCSCSQYWGENQYCTCTLCKNWIQDKLK